MIKGWLKRLVDKVYKEQHICLLGIKIEIILKWFRITIE